MADPLKEIERLDRLYNAYKQQSKRIVQLLEIDMRFIGMTTASEFLGLKVNYFYKIFNGENLSYHKLKDLYLRIQELKKIIGVKDEGTDA